MSCQNRTHVGQLYAGAQLLCKVLVQQQKTTMAGCFTQWVQKGDTIGASGCCHDS